jgi:glycosyltransferase involved in cell wall biosynthesis
MKVLHLVGATEDTGGILSVLRSLNRVLAPRGWAQAVWVNQAYRERRSPPLTYRYTRQLLAESPSHGQLLWRALRALPELRALLRQEPFAVLHAHSRGALLLAVATASVARRPVLFTNHAYARRLGLYRWAATRPRLHTAVLTPNMARHYGFALSQPRLAVVSECCDDRFFAPPLLGRPRAKAEGGPVRLAGLGNIVRWKNWHLLLEALGRLTEAERSQVEFHHWGPTPNEPEAIAYREELERRVGRLGLGGTATFHGLLLSVETALAEADWFVLPSTNEPCSVALIEALAMGVPVIASASGGNVDIVREGRTGWLFRPDDVEDLARVLRAALRGEARLEAPDELRSSVRQRSATAVAEQYLELYQRLAWPALGRDATENRRTAAAPTPH